MFQPIYSWHPLHYWLCEPYSRSESFERSYLFSLIEIILESKFRTPKRLLVYRLWNAYQWLYWTNVIQAKSTRLTIIILKSVLCGSVNKTSDNNLQRHIKVNNKCKLVVDLIFFCFTLDACLLPLRKQIIAKREKLSYITSNSKRTDNYDYSERVR